MRKNARVVGRKVQQQEGKRDRRQIRKVFCFSDFLLRHGEPWQVIKFERFLFLRTVNAIESRSEVDDFGNRKNSLKVGALIQVRNGKAEPMNITKYGQTRKKVGGWNPALFYPLHLSSSSLRACLFTC